MTRLFFVFICLISGVFSAALKVDELLTKEDTLKVLSTFSYINILKKDPNSFLCATPIA